jgi:hypothetical protein
MELLRAEMRGVAAGMQTIISALAMADWASIAITSEQIRASYLLEQSLTPAQAEELDHALPEKFTRLDSEFHARAEKLAAAAAAHDPELVVYHYSRLLESCVQCHSAYASARFPGFSPPESQQHTH